MFLGLFDLACDLRALADQGGYGVFRHAPRVSSSSVRGDVALGAFATYDRNCPFGIEFWEQMRSRARTRGASRKISPSGTGDWTPDRVGGTRVGCRGEIADLVRAREDRSEDMPHRPDGSGPGILDRTAVDQVGDTRPRGTSREITQIRPYPGYETTLCLHTRQLTARHAVRRDDAEPRPAHGRAS